MEDSEVNIYSTTPEVIQDMIDNGDGNNTTYSVKDFVDDTFGEFNNSIFYDYCQLFFMIIILVFFIRLVSLLFSK